MFTIIGAIAGTDRGHWTGPVFGAAFMLTACGSLWLHGCYKRGQHVEARREATKTGTGTGGAPQ